MFCKKCGSKIGEGMKFCRVCGSPQTLVNASEAPQETVVVNEAPQEEVVASEAPQAPVVTATETKPVGVKLPIAAIAGIAGGVVIIILAIILIAVAIGNGGNTAKSKTNVTKGVVEYKNEVSDMVDKLPINKFFEKAMKKGFTFETDIAEGMELVFSASKNMGSMSVSAEMEDMDMDIYWSGSEIAVNIPTLFDDVMGVDLSTVAEDAEGGIFEDYIDEDLKIDITTKDFADYEDTAEGLFKLAISCTDTIVKSAKKESVDKIIVEIDGEEYKLKGTKYVFDEKKLEKALNKCAKQVEDNDYVSKWLPLIWIGMTDGGNYEKGDLVEMMEDQVEDLAEEIVDSQDESEIYLVTYGDMIVGVLDEDNEVVDGFAIIPSTDDDSAYLAEVEIDIDDPEESIIFTKNSVEAKQADDEFTYKVSDEYGNSFSLEYDFEDDNNNVSTMDYYGNETKFTVNTTEKDELELEWTDEYSYEKYKIKGEIGYDKDAVKIPEYENILKMDESDLSGLLYMFF